MIEKAEARSKIEEITYWMNTNKIVSQNSAPRIEWNLKEETIENYEQFLVIGVPPYGSDTPEVLICYPPVQLPSLSHKRIIEHVLPSGINKRKNRAGNNLIQEEFVFQFVAGEVIFYGVCVQIMIHSGHYPFFISAGQKDKLYALVIISKIPCLSTHFTFLTHLANIIANTPSDLTLLNVEPETPRATGTPIPELLITKHIGHNKIFPIPMYFANLIHLYHMLGPTSPPMCLSKNMMLYFAPSSDPISILWAGLDTVFSVLEIGQIIDIFAAILLDRQIVVIGSCLEEVSMTVLSIMQMIKPLKYSGICIPMIPQTVEYFNLLQAPTPYIIGTLPNDKLLEINFLETSVFVNLDKKVIQVDEQFPDYPNKTNICNQLKTFISKATKDDHPLSFPPSYIKTLKHKYKFSPALIDEIVNTIKAPLQNICSDFVFCFFMTDLDREGQSTIFSKDLFLDTMGRTPFFLALLESMTFEMYIQSRLDQFLIMKGEDITKRKRGRRTTSRSMTLTRRMSVKVLGL